MLDWLDITSYFIKISRGSKIWPVIFRYDILNDPRIIMYWIQVIWFWNLSNVWNPLLKMTINNTIEIFYSSVKIPFLYPSLVSQRFKYLLSIICKPLIHSSQDWMPFLECTWFIWCLQRRLNSSRLRWYINNKSNSTQCKKFVRNLINFLSIASCTKAFGLSVWRCGVKVV